MSQNADNAFNETYQSIVIHRAQQEFSTARPYVREEPMQGNVTFYDRVGLVEMEPIESRHADTVYTNTPHDKRRVSGKPHAVADIIDTADKLRSLINIGNAYQTAQARAGARFWDDLIVAAAHGSAYGGDDGTTEVTWASLSGVNDIPADWDFQTAGTDHGMSTRKIAEGIDRILANDVDDEIHVLMKGRQFTNLATETVFGRDADPAADVPIEFGTSAQGNFKHGMVTGAKVGTIPDYMGASLHRCQRILTDTNSFDEVIMFARQSLLLGVQMDLRTRMTEMPTKNYGMQVWSGADGGAVRMDEEGVMKIQCLSTW